MAEALHCWEQKTSRRRLKRLKNGKVLNNTGARLGKRKRRRNQRKTLGYANLLNNDDRANVQDASVKMKRRRRNRINRKIQRNKSKYRLKL